jgi:hypothetical protein
MDRHKQEIDDYLELAKIFAHYRKMVEDPREVFALTCQSAMRDGFIAAACWTTVPMLAAKRPTHALALTKAPSAQYFCVTHSGLSLINGLDVMFDQITGEAGWKLITGAAADVYKAYAEQPIPADIEYKKAAN